MPDEPIASLGNERIKALVRLRKRRERDRTGRFLIEGYREILRAVEGAIPIDELYICPELFLGGNEPSLVERAAAAGARIIPVAPDPFRKASYRDRPEGLLAIAPQFEVSTSVLPADGDPLYLVAEAIEKPGNLGTMLRTAEAAGASGVMVSDPTTDPFNPNVVRASLGTLFRIPLAVVPTPDCLAFLRERGVRSFAATPAAARSLFEADLTGPTALVIGSEQYGLTPTWLDGADEQIRIPMPGSVDSLNAATAAAIVLFEAVRQRAAT